MKIIIEIKMQETYYRDKNANVSDKNGGPLQCQLISWT